MKSPPRACLITAADFHDPCRMGNSNPMSDIDEDEASNDEQRHTKFELHFVNSLESLID
jgi:hypothetical protein